jgi:hypothetical protein
MIPKWFRLPSTMAADIVGDGLESMPMDAMWPEQRFIMTELLELPANEEIYGRVDYDTLAGETALEMPQEEHLVTKDKKHRLRSWRFVRVQAEDSE